jgi:NADPH:quinone reductase-like Zn-dependent oxidoreductase
MITNSNTNSGATRTNKRKELSMKAAVYKNYGSPTVVHYTDVAKPTPAENEVLIRVYAAGLNAADCHMVSGTPFLIRLMMGGIFKPKHTILGAAVAGRVEAVGSAVKQFKPGDEVYGDLSSGGWGTCAEYVCAREEELALKPTQLSFEEAAAVPMAAVTALQGLRDKGHLKAGQKVLIYGASGGVGTFAVQIAKALGAEVTAVCSTKKIEMVRSLGADYVIDYTKEDFAQSEKRFDLIIGANGNRPLSDFRRVLAPQGTFVMTGGSMGMLFAVMTSGKRMSRSGQTFTNLMAHASNSDLAFLNVLLQARQIIPVIDRCYPLEQAAEALHYLNDGHAAGKVVVTVHADQ